MTSGERRVGVNFSPSRNTMVDTIKRKAADLIDHINGLETADFNEPGEVARLKVLAMTDIESAAIWSVKASALSGAAQRRLVATLQQFCDAMDWPRQRCWSQAFERVKEATTAAPAAEPAPGTSERMTTDEMAKALIDGGVRPQGAPRRYIRQLRLWVGCDGELARGAPITRCLATPAPRVEVPRATPADRLHRRPPRGLAPRARTLARLEKPDATRRSAAPRIATTPQPSPSPLLDPLTAPHRARRSPTRRRSLAPPARPAASTRPHPRRPRLSYAAPLRAHIGASRDPVTIPLPHATQSHQMPPCPSTPAFAHSDPRGTPCTEPVDGSPPARIRPRRGRKCPSRAPRRIDRHASAARPRHAPGAQRALQHRRFDCNILWLGSPIIAESG